MTDTSFVCASCGKTHEGLPTDWAFKLPEDIWVLSFLDKYRRTRTNTDLCALDEARFFIRGMLQIPFKHQENQFAWGVWAEVSRELHDFYVDNYSNEESQGTAGHGALANVIPGYEDSAGQPLLVSFQNGKSRPLFSFAPSVTSALATLQREGVDAAGHHGFLELCGYFDESDA